MPNHTIFITGADKGLGLALVGRFLRAGFQVFAGVYQSAENLERLPKSDSRVLVPIPLDVMRLESVIRAARLVAAQSPALDILINNAGVHLESSKLALEALDFADRHLQETMEVNAFGPLRVTQQFLPLLEKGRRKAILNVSSEAGSLTDCRREAWFAYCMSKAALNMQSKILRNYLQPRGFRVLAIHPGWMRTDMGGPNADLHPDQSAEGIYQLALQPGAPDEPFYLDYRGNPLPW